ncbi:ornithine decarboxylase, partial [Nephila pilipes]
KNLNLNVVGVSFHVGALCESPDTYKSAIENSRLVFDSAERHGFKLSIVDIGAGFFGTAEKEKFFCEVDVSHPLISKFYYFLQGTLIL